VGKNRRGDVGREWEEQKRSAMGYLFYRISKKTTRREEKNRRVGKKNWKSGFARRVPPTNALPSGCNILVGKKDG